MVSRVWWIAEGLALGLICYYLPWYTHETAGFTTHAFDLAEWSSIHPAVRAESPAMLTSFLLRAPQLALIVALALAANKLSDVRARWILRGIALLLVLRFVPPSDFFSNARDDPNYRQMALLTGLGFALTLAAIPLERAPERWQDGAVAVLLLAGVVAGWMGLSRAGILLDNFEIDVSVGPGIIGLSLVSALTGAVALWPHVGFLRTASPKQMA
jgi:hypothetical protein